MTDLETKTKRSAGICPPPLPGRNRIGVAPQAELLLLSHGFFQLPRIAYGIRAEIVVDPGHAGLYLPLVDGKLIRLAVLAVVYDGHGALVIVLVHGADEELLSVQQFPQMIAGGVAEGLLAFRRVHAVEAHFDLALSAVFQFEAVAVGKADEAVFVLVQRGGGLFSDRFCRQKLLIEWLPLILTELSYNFQFQKVML